MDKDFKTIGLLDINILPYLKMHIPAKIYDNLINEMKKHKINEDDIIKMLLHENDDERLFTITFKGKEKDLYLRVKKGDL